MNDNDCINVLSASETLALWRAESDNCLKCSVYSAGNCDHNFNSLVKNSRALQTSTVTLFLCNPNGTFLSAMDDNCAVFAVKRIVNVNNVEGTCHASTHNIKNIICCDETDWTYYPNILHNTMLILVQKLININRSELFVS